MLIGRVVGTLVSTQKHRKFEGGKVLIVLEGRAAGEALGRKAAPVDAAIVGIVDMVTISG